MDSRGKITAEMASHGIIKAEMASRGRIEAEIASNRRTKIEMTCRYGHFWNIKVAMASYEGPKLKGIQ